MNQTFATPFIVSPLPPSYPWLTPKQAGPVLDRHPETLRKMIRKGVLLPGKHYRAMNPQSTKPRWQINVEKVSEYLSIQTEAAVGRERINHVRL